jgi:polysaccharide biosynthesis transport protein
MPLKSPNSPTLSVYWNIARRRFWWAIIPLFACWLTIWAISWRVPPKYQSDALILVQQPEVPDNYVVSNVRLNLQDRLHTMTQQILSRTRLQSTMDRFHLYASHSGFGGFTKPGDPIDEMRKDIKIELVQAPGQRGELTAFKIQYFASSPELAQQVNSELTSLFIEENLKSEQQLSETTTAFLSSHLAEARAKLEEQEAKVRAFKASHFGDLPAQMQSNVQILSGLQAQLETAQRDLDGARQQRLYLESLRGQYQARHGGENAGDPAVDSPETLEKELTDLRLQLANARSAFTEDHPDVIRLRDKISNTEKLKKQIDDNLVSPQKPQKQASPVQGAEDMKPGGTSSMMQIQSQLKANELEIQNYQRREKDIESRIAAYQARLNLTPQTEQELVDVSRGYEESVSNYNSLLQKQMQSQLATSLEQHQQGEQFRILDPPSLPLRPISPNHLLISVAGLVFGGFIGVCLAAFLELTDVRVWQAQDLEGLVPARVLVALPHLATPGEDRTRLTAQVIRIAVALLIVAFIISGNLYSFYKG